MFNTLKILCAKKKKIKKMTKQKITLQTPELCIPFQKTCKGHKRPGHGNIRRKEDKIYS